MLIGLNAGTTVCITVISLEFTVFSLLLKADWFIDVQWLPPFPASLLSSTQHYMFVLYIFNFFPSFSSSSSFCSFPPWWNLCNPSKHDTRVEWISSESSCQCEPKLDPSPRSAFDLLWHFNFLLLSRPGFCPRITVSVRSQIGPLYSH